jgi:hypothetical protein
MGGLFCFAPVLVGVAPKVAGAFRTGGGVRFEEFGPECVEAPDMINNGKYVHRFGSHWLSGLGNCMGPAQTEKCCTKPDSAGSSLDIRIQTNLFYAARP